MQSNPVVELSDDKIVESAFERFKCPVELVVPYQIRDPQINNMFSAYFKSRFRGSHWNMDSPWMMAIGATLLLNLVGFGLLALVRDHVAYPNIISGIFSGFAASTLFAIPLTYALLVAVNLSAGYGPSWWRRLAGPTHIGITELGFKLYVRGKFFYNYPNLAVWKDIAAVDIIEDPIYKVPALRYRINSNYTFKDVILPITGFSSESHLRTVLTHLRDYVDAGMLSDQFKQIADADFDPMIAEYRNLTDPG
jgi:hypothetical protein